MASDFTNRVGAPPTKLIIPGPSIPKPPSLGITAPAGVVTPRQSARMEITNVTPKPTDDRTAYVQNSKNGDILNILPILYQKYIETGQRQVLGVSRAYAGLLTGCSYIEPLIWDGDWTDLNGALKQAQETFKTVVPLSTFGKTLNLTKQTPSFALEQWRLGGVLDKFDTWPLVFDQRNATREAKLLEKYVPSDASLILVADHSQSSPFDQTDKLVRLVLSKFGSNHYVLRLSEVQAEQIYDLLALYERAACLVSIETMHLHLAAACPGLAVVALVTDKPEMWHGTAWRKNYLLHCRYCDFEQRQDEIVRAIKEAIDSHDQPEITVTGTGGYNMTSLEWQGNRVAVFRWHPKPNEWRTELAAWTGTRTAKIAPPKGFEQHSLEDGRLFIHNGKLMLSYTVASQKGCVIQYGELDTGGSVWRIVNHFQPVYTGNDFTTMQKNWSFWSADGRLYAAYERSPANVVLELDGNRVVNVFKTQSPEWSYGQLRGGTMPIDHKGLWLQFFHSSTRNNKSAWGWTYYLGALLMEKTAPFQIVAISKLPIMAGTERYFPVPRWKPRILFPAGAIKIDGEYVVSLGVNDAATAKVSLNEKDLNL